MTNVLFTTARVFIEKGQNLQNSFISITTVILSPLIHIIANYCPLIMSMKFPFIVWIISYRIPSIIDYIPHNNHISMNGCIELHFYNYEKF